MRKSALLLLAFIVACTMEVSAQTRTITGRVTDAQGAPVPNVSVTVKGSSVGTTTDADGNYTISVPANGRTLVFSSVNFSTREQTIGTGDAVNVNLTSADRSLDEVVVVGYGTQRRRDVTAAISTIGGDKIKNIPIQSFEQGLSGKAAGVNVQLPNGVIGNAPVVRVRGVNSISGSSFPLVVIDGVPVFTENLSSNLSPNNPLQNINPADIEDIQILKDAAASAIYGSRAANGVMLVTTKKGRQGRAKVNYDTWVGWSQPFRLFDVLNAEDYVSLKNEAIRNNPRPIFNGHVPGSPLFFLDTINGSLVDTDWADIIYRTGFQQNHNLSVSGANSGTRYFLSANYTNQEGMIKNNDFQRAQMRLNVDQKVNNWLSVGGNLNFSRGKTTAPSTGSIPGTAFATAGAARLAFVTAPNVSPLRPDGRYNILGLDNALQRNQLNQIGRNRNLINSGFLNPQMILDLNRYQSETDQLQGNVYAEISPVKGLTFRSQYGVNWQTTEDQTFLNPLHGDGVNQLTITTDDGVATNVIGKFNISNFQNFLNYNTSFDGKHNLAATLGHEEQYTTTNRWGAVRSGVTDGFFNEYQGAFTVNENPVGNLITENYLLSFFGRLNYNFKNRYYISGTARRDGYSAFAAGRKWGNFFGAGAGWTISEEAFFEPLKGVISSLRLRGSYGQVGNLSAVNDFGSLSTFSSFQYGLGYPTLFYSQAGNPDLTWEKSTKTDIGLAFGLFNERLSGEINYYNTDLSDLIINRPLPSSMGVPGNSIQANAAAMYNRGIEFNLNASVIQKKDFNWNVNFNITTQKNEVTALAPGVSEIIGLTQLERTNITRVGHPLGSFFTVRTGGVDPATGQRIFIDAQNRRLFFNFADPGGNFYRLADGTIANPINIAVDGVISGNPHPTAYGGFNNTLSYKGIDLNIDAFFSLGNQVYFGSRAGMLDQRFWNNFQEVKNRWQRPGDVTDIPRIVYNDNFSNGSAFPLDVNVYDADFLRIRSLALGYTLPASWIGRAKLSSVRIYAQALNPILLTKYPGIDPEISANANQALTPGVDRNTVGQVRTYTFGINVGF